MVVAFSAVGCPCCLCGSDQDDAAIATRLAGDAGGHAGDRSAASFGDRLAALDALFGSGAGWQPRASGQDAVGDGILNLIQHSHVARPTVGLILSVGSFAAAVDRIGAPNPS
jgi:hypothetical protein